MMQRKDILHPMEKRVFFHINRNNLDGVIQSLELIKDSLKDERTRMQIAAYYLNQGLPTLTCRDENGCGFLLAALNKRSTNPKIYKYLFEELKNKEDVIFNKTNIDGRTVSPFSKILHKKDHEFLATFLSHVEKTSNNKIWLQTIDDLSSLLYTAIWSNEESFDVLLNKILAEDDFLDLINAADKDGYTLLHYFCIYHSQTPISFKNKIKKLLAAGADATVIDNHGKTPFDHLDDQACRLELKRISLINKKTIPLDKKPLYLILNEQRIELLKVKKELENQINLLKTKPQLTTAGSIVEIVSNAFVWLLGYAGGTTALIYKLITASTKEENDFYSPFFIGFSLLGPAVAGLFSYLIHLGTRNYFENTIQPRVWQALLSQLKTDILDKLNEIKKVDAEQTNSSITFAYKNGVWNLEQGMRALDKELRIRTVEQLFKELIPIIDDFLPSLNVVRIPANLLHFKPKEVTQCLIEMEDENSEELKETDNLVPKFP